jgi:viroplasmin and RNaseH domain-containing protein
VVYKGKVPGVYHEWKECFKQVNKFKDNCYKGYMTIKETKARWMNHLREAGREGRKKTWHRLARRGDCGSSHFWRKKKIAVLVYFIVV